MDSAALVQRNVRETLASLFRRARRDLLISSPYVGCDGAELVLSNITDSMRKSGTLTVLTDLSPLNICQSSTDPVAVLRVSKSIPRVQVRHLPRLHAKVYVADNESAIITSANLTAGGLARNYEYGVELLDPVLVSHVRGDVAEYAQLGALVGAEELIGYCDLARELRAAFEGQQRSISATIKARFDKHLHEAEDELIRLRLAEGALHTVFAKTIHYLLRRHGPMTTQTLHPIIAAIHPDLCDDNVDRIIDGKSFGKKWKHAARTAQQQLKKRGLIAFDGSRWRSI